jgi:hypothetical protein
LIEEHSGILITDWEQGRRGEKTKAGEVSSGKELCPCGAKAGESEGIGKEGEGAHMESRYRGEG